MGSACRICTPTSMCLISLPFLLPSHLRIKQSGPITSNYSVQVIPYMQLHYNLKTISIRIIPQKIPCLKSLPFSHIHIYSLFFLFSYTISRFMEVIYNVYTQTLNIKFRSIILERSIVITSISSLTKNYIQKQFISLPLWRLHFTSVSSVHGQYSSSLFQYLHCLHNCKICMDLNLTLGSAKVTNYKKSCSNPSHAMYIR